MPIADPTPTPANEARSIEAGILLIGSGAVLLFVSLFLEWYEPGIDAWEIFEVWDLVLALLAGTAFAGVGSRMGFGPPRPATWLIVPAATALVIVLFNIVNPPPLTPDIDGDPGTGLWLAFAASILMAAGAVLSTARISVAFAPADGAGARAPGRFGRSRTTGEPVEPVAPVGGPGVPAGPLPGDRPTPPTEPTRRL